MRLCISVCVRMMGNTNQVINSISNSPQHCPSPCVVLKQPSWTLHPKLKRKGLILIQKLTTPFIWQGINFDEKPCSFLKTGLHSNLKLKSLQFLKIRLVSKLKSSIPNFAFKILKLPLIFDSQMCTKFYPPASSAKKHIVNASFSFTGSANHLICVVRGYFGSQLKYQ